MRLEKSRSGYYPKGYRTKEAIANRACAKKAESAVLGAMECLTEEDAVELVKKREAEAA